MPGIVTKRFRIHNAEQFKEAFSEAADSVMYLFVGQIASWSNDAAPPTPSDTVQETRYDIWRTMIGGKRIQSADVSFAASRYNWANNTLYHEYDSNDATLASNTFYVMTDDYNVYKCLFNNNTANSTIKPTGTATSTLNTADGYKWKFLYNISAAEALKFVTTNYIPVKTLSANDGSSQWSVQQAASNGAIEIIDVLANGTSYDSSNGTISGVTNTSVIVLPSHASGTDNIYNGYTLYIPNGLGAGQIKEVVDYVGTSRTVTLNSGFSISPNTSSLFHIAPKIAIGGDGSGASAYANVTSGQLTHINIINIGSSYSKANVVITANAGSGATAHAHIAQPDGHGSNPVGELFAHNVMLNVQLNGSEGNTLPTNNDFRIIGLLKDPILANGLEANTSTFNQTAQLTVSSVSGSYTIDEVISGGTSTSNGRIVRFANTNAGGTAGVLHVVNENFENSFSNGEVITGGTSSVTATITNIAAGDLTPYKGDVIYIENRSPISRSVDQIEDIKIVVQF